MDKDSNHADFFEDKKTQITAWQRISPLAIIYFLVLFFKHVFGNIVYVAPAIIIGYDKVIEQPHIWLPIIYGVIVLSTLYSILSFYFFQYRLTDQQIEIRSGVLSKTNINLPFSRIQNVELIEPWFYRPFDYTCMQLDTAGSSQQEAKVIAIKKSFAIELKQQIISIRNHTADKKLSDSEIKNSEQEIKTKTEPEIVLDKRNLDDLVIHGLTNNRVWIFLAGLAPFIETISEKISHTLMRFGINIEYFFQFEGMSIWQIMVQVFTLVLIILIPITVFSILGSIIAFHDFTLFKSGDRYIRRSGLFTRNEVTMRLSRLQMIVLQQDWLDKILGRINLKFEQSNANIVQPQGTPVNNKIIVPSVTRTECQNLVDDAYPENKINQINYHRVSWRLLLRNTMFFCIPLLVLMYFIIITPTQADSWILYGILVVFISLITFLNYWRWGYASDDNFIYIRKGCFGINYYCFKRYKTQQTIYKQSWFLKRNKLCSVQFVLASGMVSIPYLTEEAGTKLLDGCLLEVEQSKRNWM